MTNTEIKQNDVQEQNNSSLVQKIIAIIFWVLSVASFLLLIKTELRKWLVFEGEPSSANSVMFWIALGLCVLFAYLGIKTWASYKVSTRNQTIQSPKQKYDLQKNVRD